MFLSLLSGFFVFSFTSGNSSFLSPLSPEEERRYLNEYKEGSVAAKNVLIERNLRLVAHIAKKYVSFTKDMDDLISIGTIGLIKAVLTFNQDKGARLGTYASKCIDNAIHT